MIGRHAISQKGLRRWVQSRVGVLDIHARQKWSALWTQLSQLPEDGIRLLDAGCGPGMWSLELAQRRPKWTITGLDREAHYVEAARKLQNNLSIPNASFIVSEFLSHKPDELYDVVLSVDSSHYLVAGGQGSDLFSAFRSWLKPSGQLFLFGPRRYEETPYVSWLPTAQRWNVYSETQLRGLCSSEGLMVERLDPAIFRFGALAKQLSWVRPKGALHPLLYPVQYALGWLDRHGPQAWNSRSVSWVLSARPAPNSMREH
jgi:SAM-dependent methyltransferase